VVDLLPVGLRGALDRRDVQTSRGSQSVTDGPTLTAHIPPIGASCVRSALPFVPHAKGK
jgi:hypothetical protein